MNYDQKKGWESNCEFDSQPQIPLEKGSNDLQLENAIRCWKDFFDGYKILPLQAPKKKFRKDMSVQISRTTRVPILGLPIKNAIYM
jgi:hypothetical protein